MTKKISKKNIKKRNKMSKTRLSKRKISCQIHYPYSLNKLKPFKKVTKNNYDLKDSEKWSNECLSLPIHSKMKSNEVHRVISEINNFFYKNLKMLKELQPME